MWLEGGGEEDKVQVLKGALASLCLSVCQLQGCSVRPTLKLCSIGGEINRQADRQVGRRKTDNSSPPLPLTLSSSALWSWMELNANDLTELNLLKSVFIFLLVGSDCFISAVSLDAVLCTVLQCLLLIWNNVLAYYKSSLFFSQSCQRFLSGGWKKYCENLASRFLLDKETDCLGRKKTHKKPKTKS